MESWNTINVYVHYSPSDPGIRNFFTDKTVFQREEIAVGKRLAYEDSGRLFGSIVVKAFDDESVTIEYRGQDYILNTGKSRELDQGGRDYTNFWLSIQLV